jgi:hypothetical protein
VGLKLLIEAKKNRETGLWRVHAKDARDVKDSTKESETLTRTTKRYIYFRLFTVEFADFVH